MEKEAGFGILNSLPGAKPTLVDTKQPEQQKQPEKTPEATKTDEQWLSIWNDLLFK